MISFEGLKYIMSQVRNTKKNISVAVVTMAVTEAERMIEKNLGEKPHTAVVKTASPEWFYVTFYTAKAKVNLKFWFNESTIDITRTSDEYVNNPVTKSDNASDSFYDKLLNAVQKEGKLNKKGKGE